MIYSDDELKNEFEMQYYELLSFFSTVGISSIPSSNKIKLPDQTYQIKPIKSNLPNWTYLTNLPKQTYKTKLTKPNIPNKTYQTYYAKPTKLNLPTQTYKTFPTKSKHQISILSKICQGPVKAYQV